jgi:hypothetical protein
MLVPVLRRFVSVCLQHRYVSRIDDLRYVVVLIRNTFDFADVQFEPVRS